MTDEHEWVATLRRAAGPADQGGLGSKQAVADTLGVSRTMVSLVLAGSYGKDTSRLEAAVRRVLLTVTCPYLDAVISGGDCLTHQRREAPATAAEEGYWHARACRACRVGVGKAGAP